MAVGRGVSEWRIAHLVWSQKKRKQAKDEKSIRKSNSFSILVKEISRSRCIQHLREDKYANLIEPHYKMSFEKL